jgi:predicted RNA-binding protein with PUA-like domain
MQYWLFKSEPSTWSWDDQLGEGESGTGWDGVRNYQASNNMNAMKIGDLGFFYHSVNEKRIVGIVEVCGLYHSDDTDPTGRFGMVDVRAITTVNRPVTLAEIKENPNLSDIALVRQSRLSVSPISHEHWAELLRMAQTKL